MLQRLKRSRICVGLAALGVTAMSGCLSSEFGVAPTDESNPSTTLTRDSSPGPGTNSTSDDVGSLDDDAATGEEDAGELSESGIDSSAAVTADSGVTDSGVVDSGVVVVPLSTLVSIPRPGGGAAFSIESREVSQKQYQAFLVAKAASPPVQTAPCTANSDLIPKHKWDPVTTPNRPVVGIDWCDARAYCSWAGRHLCGGFAGTSLSSQSQSIDAAKSEWYIACSKAGAQQFPYSVATNNDAACNVLKSPATGSAANVGATATCVGGYTGLYDMVGNAAEWIDACDTGGSCAIMGGSWHAGSSPVSCGTQFGGSPTSYFDDLGFRCCKD